MTGPATFTARDESVYDGPEDLPEFPYDPTNDPYAWLDEERTREREANIRDMQRHDEYIPLEAHPSGCDCNDCAMFPDWADDTEGPF